ncbi:MAG: DUF378 domain-containing protein [Caloramator sp.]|nr:DUF378 domain-containing protein [Caloramator sp.]
MKIDTLDWFSIALTVVGALNWGLIGLFNFDLVAFLFGPMSTVSRIVYTIVGISGIYLIYTSSKFSAASIERD